MKNFFLKPSYTSEKIIHNIKTRTKYEKTIEHLYDKYFLSVKKIIVNLGGSSEDAEDIFQDALAKVIWSIDEDKFQGKSHISTYLITIAKNMWLKTLQKKSKHFSTPLEEGLIDQLSGDEELLEDIPLGNDDDLYTKSMFEDLIEKIGVDCRNILKNYYFDKLSYNQILDRNKGKYSSEQALRNKKSRCLKYLKEGLQDKLDDKDSLLNIISSCL
ncbi:sigma-70 family RNA polymerase sigma factor [Flammeovirga yaeyamensis]|uniref:Sigma-70 family RNA polymerase sigma factor n=1 Tax=Flammeovirga yaeyamensis TaxID=367791 RepID=A0AAX1N4X6_9BACT|nr:MULTISPECIES: sigma-70 family RNA polymerase sigma factor [Flammeovirga]ANQ49931.1 sigma-70 family RNA polymerase sigma factor [Flammeovirga sp. MY04]MBB3701321.1 RNA polymerase sigma factor (sigma-70 family) [Flammeovirga yaeyamensis]NMF38210.1 sigma-70 family RNA polymerase sigma factor [Flammeovirga yaeyamensis]QWG02623.1 sigma-70 family RNA polymerase sigma factor [Flammeovirga yaeyamensis]